MRGASSTAAAFVLTLGVDLLLHAGLLARLYADGSPFLLDAETAFRRIPLGYAAFLVLTVALRWLCGALDVRGAGAGFRVGATCGAVVWGALVLGLFSIATAGGALLLGWWVGQALELGAAGAVLGAARAGVPARTLWLRVVGAVVLCVAATVVLQALGLAPPMRTSG